MHLQGQAPAESVDKDCTEHANTWTCATCWATPSWSSSMQPLTSPEQEALQCAALLAAAGKRLPALAGWKRRSAAANSWAPTFPSYT